MACFIVPAAEAAVTTIVSKAVKSAEGKEMAEAEVKIPLSRKLGWLNKLLWGGSGLLAFEHVWHGEITPWFPFLSAAANPVDAAQMLREMSVTGVGMAAAVTLAWLGMVAVVSAFERKGAETPVVGMKGAVRR